MKSILTERHEADWAELEEEASLGRRNKNKETKKRTVSAQRPTQWCHDVGCHVGTGENGWIWRRLFRGLRR